MAAPAGRFADAGERGVPRAAVAPPANREELSPLSFLERAAQAYGARTAVVDRDRRLTYAELRDRVHRLAAALRGRAGIAKGDRVAVLAPNSPALLESHFGVPLAGGVLVAINTRLSPEEIAYILEHCSASTLIVDGELYHLVEQSLPNLRGLKTVVCATAAGAPAPEGAEDYEALLDSAPDGGKLPRLLDENEVISINYTSGTTGKPKGVMYTHRGAYLNALHVAFGLRMGADSVYLWTLPMFHCNGWCCVWGVTAAGGRHVILRRVDPPVVWDVIERESVTHLCAAPTVLVGLANDPSARRIERALPLLVATGGAPPSPTTIAQMSALGVEVSHLYGMTETYGPAVTCAWWPEWSSAPAEEQARLKARQGVPHAGLAGARVVDEALRDVPADGESMGELVVRGNTIMAGYFHDEAATAAAFRGGWLHTGDLGVVHEDGYVELRDRAKDVIISGGENISSVEIEQVLMRHAAVLEVAVVGVPDEKWGEVPKAFVTLKPGGRATAEELAEFCRQHLARFKAPRSVEFGELPKTSTGKIQKFLLRAKEWEGRAKRIN